MRSSTALRIALGAVVVGLLAIASCGTGDRAFRADRSVTITAPKPLAVVSTPFTVAWKGRSGQHYAVFVDLPPMSVGGSLRDYADSTCKQSPGCKPSVSYLNSDGIYIGTDRLTVTNLLDLTGVGAEQKYPVHTLTIVPIDSGWRRVGTGAWSVEFRD